jgi:hypothetical protein
MQESKAVARRAHREFYGLAAKATLTAVHPGFVRLDCLVHLAALAAPFALAALFAFSRATAALSTKPTSCFSTRYLKSPSTNLRAA